MNLMLYILDHTEPVHEYKEPQLQNSYVAYALNYIHDHYTTKILQEDIAIQLKISVRYLYILKDTVVVSFVISLANLK